MLKKINRYFFRWFHPIIGEVWQLHRVSNMQSLQNCMRPYEITPERLESLIISYLDKGCEFVSMETVEKRMQQTQHGSFFVAVTLDDGYADNFEVALPIFKKYNIPFCIYLTEKFIREGSKASPQEESVEHYSYLTEQQVILLDKEPLCTIGAHTRTHVRLSQLNVEQQRHEIKGCIDWIENLLHHQIADYAFPYGDYNTDTLSIMRELKVKRAVASWGGKIRKNTAPKLFEIPRVLVTMDNIK